jgi:hypothetical protein
LPTAILDFPYRFNDLHIEPVSFGEDFGRFHTALEWAAIDSPYRQGFQTVSQAFGLPYPIIIQVDARCPAG